MPTLLLRLAGPMQSWGTSSRFDQRDTGKEPSNSGVVGLIAAALGVDRADWTDDIKKLAGMPMAVRHDRPGLLMRDYQTAGCCPDDRIIKADGSLSSDGIVSNRFYLADAAFLVGLESKERQFLEHINDALRNPVWPLALGRKSYVPSEPVWVEGGVQDGPLRKVLGEWRWISSARKRENQPSELLVSFESEDGSGLLKMDRLRSSFAERRFEARYVRYESIPFPKEAPDVP